MQNKPKGEQCTYNKASHVLEWSEMNKNDAIIISSPLSPPLTHCNRPSYQSNFLSTACRNSELRLQYQTTPEWGEIEEKRHFVCSRVL